MKRYAKLAGILAVLLALLAGCTLLPGGEPGSDSATDNQPKLLYTVDTKAEKPMLYPVLSKAKPFNPYDAEEYGPEDFATNSFKLVNEKWEDVTGYINGHFQYVYAGGEVYGVQVQPFELGEPYEYEGEHYQFGIWGAPYVLGLDGKPIEALEGLEWRETWSYNAELPDGLIFVTATLSRVDMDGEEMLLPMMGLFDTRSGKLAVPALYEELLPLDDAVLGFREGTIVRLDYTGKILSEMPGEWYLRDRYFAGDDWILVNETTYIDQNGKIMLELDGIHGITNFNGDYAVGWIDTPSGDSDGQVFINRQGEIVDGNVYSYVDRREGFYIVDDGTRVLDFSLQTVFTEEGEGYVDIVGDMIVVNHWDEATESTTVKVYDLRTGKQTLTFDGYVSYDNGFFTQWDKRLHKLFSLDGKPVFENARAMRIAGDGKYIYVDNGTHMGLVDSKGEWVYRLNAAYYNLED